MSTTFYVFMMTNKRNGKLFAGVTHDLRLRTRQIKEGRFVLPGASPQACSKLVWHECYRTAYDAVMKERQINALPRVEKERLVWQMNPLWRDLCFDLERQHQQKQHQQKTSQATRRFSVMR